MNKSILITGGTGLIGRALTNELCKQGALVKIISRDPGKVKQIFGKHYTVQSFKWDMYDTPNTLRELVEDSDAIINLAGENLDAKRWSKKYKKKIYDSRIETTRLIVNSIKLSNNKPECLVNASGVGIYGDSGDDLLTEESSPGNDFLANLCRDWETEALKAIEQNVRVVNIRTGVVLDKDGGALKEIIKPFKFFVGVYFGSGKQWMSWIHIRDLVSLYLAALTKNEILGALNGTSPYAVTNKVFTKTLGQILRRRIILPVPGFALKIFAGEFANALLTGQKVIPEKAMNTGFWFEFPELKDALQDLFKKQKPEKKTQN